MLSQTGNKANYTEFDLIDEHHFNVQKIMLDDGDTTKLIGAIRYESTASVGHSQWYE